MEPTDDELRGIARRASTHHTYSGGVKALRAVWEASRRAALAEIEARPPADPKDEQ